MDFSFTTTQTLLYIGATQGFVLAFVLLTLPRGNVQANRILAAILIIFSGSIAVHTLSHGSRVMNSLPHSAVITIVFLLFGPLFYFYAKILTTQTLSFAKRAYIHFLPFLICLLLSLPFLFKSAPAEGPHPVFEIISVFVVIHVLSYMAVIFKMLRDHSKTIQNAFSSIDRINLNWLRFLIIGFTITWLVALFFDAQAVESNGWDYVWLLVSLFMYWIGYKGLRQPEIFSGAFDRPYPDTEAATTKYRKSTLTPELGEMYLKKLQVYMKSEKPYLNCDLTLPELANNLSISVHHLSQVINENLQQNFFEFINSYRVEEAKRLLGDPENHNIKIASIAFDTGFNSISAFNAAFKKHAKMTPSVFRNSSLKT